MSSAGLLSDCEKVFGSRELYKILNVEKAASPAEVKKAYYRLSLQVHPDRADVKDRQAATERFQVLGKIYSILSDAGKRSLYDETGSVDDESFVSDDRDWDSYWRLLFPKINLKDIENFEATYKGSSEELEDLKAAYRSGKGDMDIILDTVMCSTLDDEPRFRKILEDLIEDDQLPSYKAFTHEKPVKREARKRKAEREKKEAEEERAKIAKTDDDTSLQALIQSRQQSREANANDFFTHLEQKYGTPKSKATNKSTTSRTNGKSSAGKSSSANKKRTGRK